MSTEIKLLIGCLLAAQFYFPLMVCSAFIALEHGSHKMLCVPGLKHELK